MALKVGDRLGHYDVTALLGEGGMGQVWQATDTQLGREVALKILPDAFANDPDRLARFEREAKVLASLNHPNIAAIHGIEQSGETRALVLELVEGPTLADRIAQGPIPLDVAVPIAKQIAEALEAAHDAGVIHRDLKPANVKVREDGTVKVLDFGLAKALDTAPQGDSSQSPTLTAAAATQMGVIMGTAAYMSPEQARGESIDMRVDTWAFGVVFYEMVTGRRPFEGRTVSDTLASVLARDPDLDTLPTAVRRLLSRCFEKEPRKRLRDIAEGLLRLEDGLATAPEETAAPVSQLQLWQRPLVAVSMVLTALAVGSLAVWTLTRPGPPAVQPTTRFVITQSASNAIAAGVGMRVALSPDGRTVVYRGVNEGGTQLYRRPMDRLEVIPIRDTENSNNPSFSPDGEWLAFSQRNSLMKVSLAGGSALTILQVGNARGVAWGPDETVVFGTFDSGLFRVSANGGDSEPLTTPSLEDERHWLPHLLPGGSAVLFQISTPSGEGGRLAAYSFETGAWDELSLEGAQPRYSLGHIVFAREDSLWAVPFEADRLVLTGNPFLLLEGVAANGPITQFDVAHDGTLVYVPEGGLGGGRERTVDWVDRDGIVTPLMDEPRTYHYPRFSSDGSRLLIDIEAEDNQGSRVWVRDIERGTLTPLTFGDTFNGFPIWTPDDERVTFGSTRGGQAQLYERRADGSGNVELLLDTGRSPRPSSWSPDGTVLAFSDSHPDTRIDIWVLEDGISRAFIATEARETQPMFSPDGEWMAYHSNKSGQNQVYLTTYPGPGGEQQVSTEGGLGPVWARDGTELFYRTDGGQVWSVSVQTTPALELGTPQRLFEIPDMAPGVAFDVHPDGERFVVVRSVDGESNTTQINVVLNWLQERAEREPAP